MNPSLKKLLVDKNIRIINSIRKSLNDDTVVGWHLSAPSAIRKDQSVSVISSFIKDNNLPYYIEDYGGSVNGKWFFLFIN